MSEKRKINIEETVIHVIENEVDIFQYDYMDLWNLWLNHIDYIPEEPDDVREPESYYISIRGNELAVALLEGSDQGGILGIIDISTGNLIHAQEAAYYISSITTKDKVITLNRVHYYGTIPYFMVEIKSKGGIDFSEPGDHFKIPQEFGLDVDDSYSLSLEDDFLIIINSKGIGKRINI